MIKESMRKYRLYFIICFCTIFTSCKNDIASKNKEQLFTLQGEITGVKDSVLFLLKNIKSNTTVDSAYVLNGRISLETKLDSKFPEDLLLISLFPEVKYTKLLVKNEAVTFKADIKDFPWNIDVIGSKHQDNAEKFNRIMHQRQTLNSELISKYDSNKELLAEKTKSLSDSLDNEMVKLIKENFNGYAALINFKHYKKRFSNEELVELYSSLNNDLKQTKYGKAVKLQSEFPNPKVGDNYYDYKAVNQNGDTISLSNINNKYILIHFSSLACYGSQLSLPDLKDIYKSHKGNLEIVSISTDVNKEQWQNHVKRDSIPWQYLWDGKGDYSDAFIKYRCTGTPDYVLLSPEKIILEKWWGYGKGIFDERVVTHLNSSQ